MYRSGRLGETPAQSRAGPFLIAILQTTRPPTTAESWSKTSVSKQLSTYERSLFGLETPTHTCGIPLANRRRSEHIKQSQRLTAKNRYAVAVKVDADTDSLAVPGVRTVHVNFISRKFELALLRQLGWWDLMLAFFKPVVVWG